MKKVRMRSVDAITALVYPGLRSPATVSLHLTDLESCRNASKKWRDQITQRLIGRISTSSQKFQDNIFEANAMPPSLARGIGKL
jgi:hypothetical protein